MDIFHGPALQRGRERLRLLRQTPLWRTSLYRASYAVAPLAVIALVLTVLIIKGIAPFGQGSMFYADMGQAYVPQYYRLYDALHGAKSLFFDWDTGMGINMVGSTSMMGLLSPFNLFFYFLPREAVASSLSIFLVLKMAVMAFAAGLFLRKTFRTLPAFPMMVISFLYATSTYVLLQYTNIMWLDIAVVFPLLMLGFVHMMRTGKKAPYILLLALCLIMNFYMSFMLCLFLLFAEGLYVLLLSGKAQRGRDALSVVLGTLAAIGLSLWMIVPTFLQMDGSMRTASAFDYLNILAGTEGFPAVNSVVKLAMLLGTELLIVAAVARAARVHAWEKDKRHVAYFAALFLAVALQIPFESTNALWHTGSYVMFPMRYGYMVTGVLGAAAAYFAAQANEKVPDLRHPRDRFLWVKLGAVNVVLVMSTPVLWQLAQQFQQYGVNGLDAHKETVYGLLAVVFVSYLVLYAVVMTIRSRRWRAVYTAVAVLVSASLCTWGLLPPNAARCVSMENSYLTKTQEVRDILTDEYSALQRVKNADLQLQTNYPLMLGRPAVSNWTHIIPKSLQKSIQRLGYSTVYTRMLDTGGTLFSDALLGVKNTISGRTLDSSLYTLANKAGEEGYYQNVYTLPFGMVMNAGATTAVSNDPLEAQNLLYQAITGDAEPLMERAQAGAATAHMQTAVAEGQGRMSLTYTLTLSGDQMLYLYATGATFQIMVNGQTVAVPNDGNANNAVYPAYYNNGMVPLGRFAGGTVTVRLTAASNDALVPAQITIGALSMDKLKALTAQYAATDYQMQVGQQSLGMTVTADSDKVMFLPIGHDDGWSCKVNGQKTALQTIAGNYIAVPLTAGANHIELSFAPPYMSPLLLVSFLTALLLLGLYAYGRFRRPFKTPEWAGIACRWMIGTAVILTALAVYVVPVLYALYSLWTGLPS